MKLFHFFIPTVFVISSVACQKQVVINVDQEDNRDTIKLAYVVEASTDPKSITEASLFIDAGEYALIVPNTLIYKDYSGSVMTIEESVSGVMQYKYEYCNKIGEIEQYDGRYRLIFHSGQTVSDETLYKGLSEGDNEIIQYDISKWPFFILNDKAIHSQLFLCYDFMDNLVKRYPNNIIKYDPMVTSEYEEDGITIYPLPTIKDRLVDVGYEDWPIYMKGIESKGDYSFSGYLKTLLPTPAYKTFIYQIKSINNNNPNTKRRFFIQAGIHSAEVMSQIGACLFAESLLTNDRNSRYLLSNYDFWIVPCLEGYGGMHGDSWTAATINANRNYMTRWWRYNQTQLYNSGLKAGDQFSTQLSMALMDYLSPDIFLDIHTLNDLVTVPSTSNITVEFITSTSIELSQSAAIVAENVLNSINKMYPDIFRKIPPRSVVNYDYPNSATGRSYMAYKHNESTIALVEVNNVLAGDDTTLNSSEALTVAAFFIRSIVYLLCDYNLAYCNSLN